MSYVGEAISAEIDWRGLGLVTLTVETVYSADENIEIAHVV